MKENKKGVNIPLFVAILGLVALAFIILLVIIHSLSPAETAGASKVTRSFVSSTSVSTDKTKSSSSTATNDFSKWKRSIIFII